ncbi:MAG: biotin carboxylase [Acidobacteria bacterium]|nr:biotin carboxylase [Acidobacteriota bacterium]
MKTLKGISDIRRYFYRNTEPIYFVSATNFNLLGMDEWVRNFKFINYIDCFDGAHPNVVTPSQKTDQVFQSIEEINNYLLEHKEIVDYIQSRGPGGKAVFLFFDERTEELCRELGLDVCFPPANLRQAMDSKLETTRLGDEAGVPSVPNWMGKVDSYETLRKLAEKGGLGEHLVVQSAFGDSGHTTYFISNKEDYEEYAEEIEREDEVKIMRRIRPKQAALEACVTRHGTIVGPLMTEVVGFKELTPYKGGWAGNEVFAGAFSQEVRDKARRYTFQFGEALRKRGYRGYFEVDYLYDLDSDDLFLGEVNPRITGASSMTNLASFAQADAPLFLFHLLEFSGVDFELDVAELNARWADPENIDSWSQLIIKHTRDSVEFITEAPRTGIWRLHPDGGMQFRRVQTHRRTVEDEYEAFFLRINGVGDYFYEGAELGILVTPGRLMTEEFQLTDRAKAWISGIRGQYRARPLQAAETTAAERVAEVGGFKFL